MEQDDTVYFMKTRDPWGEFSNFYPAKFTLDGVEWITSEHAYQAQKFTDIQIKEKIRNLRSPMAAAIEGRNKNNPIRLDWEEVKEDEMSRILYAKFSQNERLKQVLLSTENRVIVELSYKDSYWGWSNGYGQNRLGCLLMELRRKLSQEISPT